MADVLAAQLAGHAAVAQHDDAVGAALDFAEPVRDEDDADAVGLQAGDDAQQALGLGDRQAGGRLVHDHQPRLQRQRLGDLDQLALRERQALDHRIGTEVAAEPVEQRLHAPPQRPRVDQLQEAAGERPRGR